jgi:predicted TIM-barrel fold metal-dependent hydrolase
VPPLVDLAYKAFGPRRMMWGSDYPPVGGREGYRNSLQGVLELPIFKNQEEKDWAFGTVAMEVFKLT